jgi:hypothetical protein
MRSAILTCTISPTGRWRGWSARLRAPRS